MLIETRKDATVVLTLDNPGKKNALSQPLRTALHEAMERLQADGTVRAIVMTGSSGTFCSGGDIDSMASSDLAGARERFRQTHALARLFFTGPTPIVAAVEGWAAGAGFALALACDTIVAAHDARFIASFGKVGVVGDFGMLHSLPERVGAGRARQILFYGEPMDAEECHRVGIVDHLCEPGGALDFAIARANLIAASAPLSIALTRQALARNFEHVLTWERETQAMLMQTDDHKEGVAAFREKRPAIFRGR